MSKLESLLKELDNLSNVVVVKPIEWSNGKLKWLNVSQLPWKEEYIESSDINRLAQAIKNLEIRGAPAIGVAAAMGVAMAAYNSPNDVNELIKNVENAIQTLSKTRPTAYNLFWALDKMRKQLQLSINDPVEKIKETLLYTALEIQLEDIKNNIKIGEIGERFIEDGDTVLTHCNTGSLATAGYGTALGVIRTAWLKGKDIRVIATETRPLLQGARLTAWELKKYGIPFKLITDNMAGYVFSKNEVDKVFVGADRILLSGHVINKIGTYTLAVLAKHHNIPFYAVAPTSTIDPSTKAEDVIIEMRNPEEVLTILGKVRIAPEDTEVLNPAFDMTPPELVSGIITEKGIAESNFTVELKKLIMF